MPGAVFLRGDRVTLRTVEREDLDFVHAEKNKPAVHRSLVWPYPENRDALEEFLFEGDADADVKLLIAVDGEDDDPELVGSIGLDVDERPATGEVGLWIAPEYWGEGYGTEASRVLVDYAFDERNLHRLQARVMATNDASRRVWEKLGFELEGRLRQNQFDDGEYVDTLYFGLLEDEYRERTD
jgi:Acetyltransferases, including N-acetylases of ribosomal proteins